MTERLGGGSYGDVFVVDGYAKKVFKTTDKERTLIREVVTSQYCQESENVLKVVKFNINQGYHTTKLYPSTLKTVIKENTMTMPEKMQDIKSLIKGLVFMHSRDITHGDLKPSNVLYDGEKYIIADLGFTCVSKYSKTSRTAKYYREPDIVAAPAHDMYSLGIIFIEFFCKRRIKKIYTERELMDIADTCEDKQIASLIKNLVVSDPDIRISSIVLYNSMYPDTIIHLPLIVKSKIPIDNMLKKRLEKYYIRNKRACQLAYNYLKNPDDYTVYCLLYICCCVFEGELTVNRISSIFKKDKSVIFNKIGNMLSDTGLCVALYS